MNLKNIKYYLVLEIIGWIFAFLLAWLILLPVEKHIYADPFKRHNLWFVVSFITLVRYIFMIRYLFFGPIQWLKALFFLGCIPLFIYLLRLFSQFSRFADENGLESFMIHLLNDQQTSLSGYIRGEMIFFGAGSMIATVVFAIRLLVSIWLFHNRKII